MIKCEQKEYIFKEHICSAILGTLFDADQNKAIVKDLWDAFKANYLLEDTTNNEFVAIKIFNYKVTDFRSVVEQLNKIMHILDQFSNIR